MKSKLFCLIITVFILCTTHIFSMEFSRLTELGMMALINKPDTTINAQDENGQTLLHVAARQGYVKAMQQLINKKANVRIKDSHGETPLHAAATNNDLEATQLLISQGAQVNAQSNHGNTPLHYAAIYDHNQAQFLIDNGALVNIQDNDGYTPLHYAAREHYLEMLPVLINNGANVNTKNNDGDTPLHIAVQKIENTRDTDFLTELIKADAEINAENNLGQTPLFDAIDKFDTINDRLSSEVLRLLIDQGANLVHKNLREETPLQYAINKDYERAQDLLKENIKPFKNEETLIELQKTLFGKLVIKAVKEYKNDKPEALADMLGIGIEEIPLNVINRVKSMFDEHILNTEILPNLPKAIIPEEKLVRRRQALDIFKPQPSDI